MKIYTVLISLLCILTGCGTSPEPDFYSLASIPGSADPSIMTTLKVERPVLAGYLDRPDFVRQQNEYQISIDDTNNWAEPLDKMFARVLTTDLQQRLPYSVIVTDENATPDNLFYTIDLNIEHFSPTGANTALLVGQLIINNKRTHTRAMSIPLDLSMDIDNSAPGIVKSLSQLISDVADHIVIDLKKYASQ